MRTAAWQVVHAGIRSHRQDNGSWRELVLDAPSIAAHALPGQFLSLSVHAAGGGWHDPFLRRALSLCEIRPEQGTVSVVYAVGGRGTRRIASLEPDQRADVLGPLGRPFPDPGRLEVARCRGLLLAGAGAGIPPLVAAAAWALSKGRSVAAVVGAATRAGLGALEQLRRTGATLTLTTHDGSTGEQTTVPEAVARRIAQAPGCEVWASGPDEMLAAIARLCLRAGVPAYLNIERPMACGFGVCLSCTVARADGHGYLHACVDGPVFPAEEVALNGNGSASR